MSYEHERAHYRITYPTAARPRLLVGDLVHSVLDPSEQGMRLRLAEGHEKQLGDEINGLLRFRRGEELRIMGKVIRVREGEVALQLSVGVPFRLVLEEQRYLREFHRGSAW
jgi:hypothetical protein